MIQTLTKVRFLRAIASYIREFIIVALIAANAYQYAEATQERDRYFDFYNNAYLTEKDRVRKWEDIALTLRSQPSR